MTQTKKPRRRRVDSAPAISAALIAASRRVTPPPGIALDSKEAIVFGEIIGEFPKVDLTDHQVRLSALLAKEMAAADREQVALSAEGSVLVNSHGNAVLNPRVRLVQQHLGVVLSYRRSLGLTARALNGGDSRNVAIRRRHNLASQVLLDDIDDDDLLARAPADFGNPRKDN